MTETQYSPRALIAGLHALGAVRFGNFTLKSGAHSPIYLDLRLLVSDPRLLAAAAAAYEAIIAELEFDRIAAVPYAGLPIGTAVALRTNRPLIYARKEVKAYGRGRSVEGHFVEGETALVLDDLISSGGSKLEAISALQEAGLVVRDVVVLIDREGGGAEDLADAGYRLHAAFVLHEIARALAEDGRISAEEEKSVLDYIEAGRGAAGAAAAGESARGDGEA